MLFPGKSLRAARLFALSAGTILATGVVIPVSAQVAPPPPVRQSVDGNGVDLFLGSLAIQGPKLSIGSAAPKGFEYYKIYRGAGWTDNLIAVMNIAGPAVSVTFGGVTDGFTVSGSNYIATEGRGATLSLSGSTYTYIASDGTVAHFDKSRSGYAPQYATEGRVTDITAPSGETLTFSYDSVTYCSGSKPGGGGTICTSHATAYRLATVDNRYGYRVSFSNPALEADPENPDEFFDLGAWSTPTGVTLTNLATGGSVLGNGFSNAAGQTAQYRYANGLIAGITRPGSTTEDVTIGYSGARVASVATAAGTVTYSAPVDSGNVRTVAVTDPASQTTTYTFDIALQRMRTMTDPYNRTTQWDYDSLGRVTRITQPEQNYTQMTYDDRGNVREQRQVAKSGPGAGDLVTSAVYPETCSSAVTCNKPTSTTDARGGVTDYSYDPTHGGVTSVLLPAPTPGATRPETRYSYTSIQNSVTGAAVYQLTGTSTCRTTSNCLGTTDEARTTIGYEAGNLLPVTQTVSAGDGSLSASVSTSYDAIGNMVSVDGPLAGNSDTTRAVYDTMRRPTVVIGPDPDDAGDLKNPAVSYSYDALGRTITTEAGTANPDGSGFASLRQENKSYDAVDRVVQTSTAAGGTTFGLMQYSYDVAGRLQCTALRMDPSVFGSPPASACTLGAVGAAGPDRVTLLEYSPAGAGNSVFKSVTSAYGTADAAKETLLQTANGKTASVTDGKGNVTSYAYDGFDRSSTITYSGGSYEQFGYDPNGNVTTRQKRDGRTLAFEYDALNRTTSKTVPSARSVFYSYDLTGALTEARFDSLAGTDHISNQYDARGQLTSSTTSMAGATRTLAYGYDVAGHRTSITYPDGTIFGYDYDKLGRLNHLLDGTGNQLALYAYLDGSGLTWRGQGANGTGYGHDALGRVISYNMQRIEGGAVTGVNTQLSYNAASQIVEQSRASDAYAYTDTRNTDRSYATNGLNQYTNVGPDTYAYDGNGNLTSDGGNTYTYDAENRLTAVSGARNASLIYDPAGRLWESTGGSGATQFVYDGDQLVAEYNDTGGLLRRYVQGTGSDDPLLWYEGSSTSPYRLFTDHLGSVIAVTEDNGTMRQINTYDEYGVPGVNNVGRFQYTGQAWIPELGLYYYKARMYSPMLGRFMQTDPIGYGNGLNWYNYVGGDPLNATDPSGTLATTCTGSIISTSGGCGGGINNLVTYGGSWTCSNCGEKGISDGNGGVIVNAPKWTFSPSSSWLSPPRTSVLSNGERQKTKTPCEQAIEEPGTVETVTFTYTAIVGGGITGGNGTFRNTRTGTTGNFFTVGGGAGVDIGVSVTYGQVRSVADLTGFAATLSGTIGPVTGSASFNTSGLAPVGAAGGIAPPSKGGSGTLTGTKLYGCKLGG